MEYDVDEPITQYDIHNLFVHWKTMKPYLGKIFANQEELRFCFTNYAIGNKYPIKVTKSSTERLQAKCGIDKKKVKDVPLS